MSLFFTTSVSPQMPLPSFLSRDYKAAINLPVEINTKKEGQKTRLNVYKIDPALSVFQ